MSPTLLIEMERAGVGRIRVRSGTTKRRVYDAMVDMLKTLYQIGRQDILRDIKAGRLSVMDVYEKYRTGKLEHLPTGDLMRPLEAAWREWMDGHEIEELTRKDYEAAWARTAAPPGVLMTELPALLTAHRKASLKVRPRSFNKDRSMWLVFLNDTLGDGHWLHAACRRIRTLKIPDERKMAFNPQTLDQLRGLAAKMAPHHACSLWGIALTGMRPEEYFEERKNSWTLQADRVQINGTKTPAAKRACPRIGMVVKPQTKRLAFYRHLREKSGETVTPYDLRRSYARFLTDARIPQYRADYYFGHGPKTLDALYKRMRECDPYLVEDTAALTAIVAEPTGLRVVK